MFLFFVNKQISFVDCFSLYYGFKYFLNLPFFIHEIHEFTRICTMIYPGLKPGVIAGKLLRSWAFFSHELHESPRKEKPRFNPPIQSGVIFVHSWPTFFCGNLASDIQTSDFRLPTSNLFYAMI